MIDLRSDTVTRPGRAMLEAMMAAPVGDDVYGDDPTVNELQRYAADLAGKEAALFLPTGTRQPRWPAQPLPARRRVYRRPGAHNYLYEAGGAASSAVFSRSRSTPRRMVRCRWIKWRRKSNPTISILPPPAC